MQAMKTILFMTPLVGDPYAESERNWVPFLLLGGGFVQHVGPNASVYVEVLFDVLQNENSPYEVGIQLLALAAV